MSNSNTTPNPAPLPSRFRLNGEWRALSLAIVLGLLALTCALWICGLPPSVDEKTLWKLVCSILKNCGPSYAASMVFFAVTGMTYIFFLCLSQWIPSVRRISRDIAGVREAAEVFRQQFVPTPSASPTHGMNGSPNDSDSPSGRSASEEEANRQFGKSSASVPPDDTKPTSDTPDPAATSTTPTSSSSPTSTSDSPQKETASPFAGLDSALQDQHPWLRERIVRVLRVLMLQGPESARSENQAMAAQQEDEVATGLLPAQICEWILPLIGFLGTVYGLHLAIPPLKEGVGLMMKALSVGGMESLQLRELAMEMFGAGFNGLKVAFDTTMVGLVGVMFVGGELYLVRLLAMRALSQVGNIADELVLSCPKESLSEIMERIQHALNGGLFVGEEKQRRALLALVNEAVACGLLYVPQGQKEPQPLLALAARRDDIKGVADQISRTVSTEDEAIRKEMRKDIGALGRIGLNQLAEERLQTRVLLGRLAPDLLALRRHFIPAGHPSSYLIPPRIGVVADLPLDHEVHVMAVANGAGRACVGGVQKDINVNFVQETAITWDHDTANLALGISFVENLVQEEAPANIMGLTYDPRARRLLALGRNGKLRIFEDAQMHQPEFTFRGVPMSRPFLWLDDHDTWPVVGLWQRQEDSSYGFNLVTTRDGQPIPMPANTRSLLDSFTQRDQQLKPAEVKAVANGSLLALAGSNLLAVAELRGAELQLLAQRKLGQQATALDISLSGRFVVFALEDGTVCRWDFTQSTEAPVIAAVPDGQKTGSLFLNASSDSLAILFGATVALQDLTDLKTPPQVFDTRGVPAKHVAQSLDRASLLVSTENNVIMLFDFGLRI